MSNNKRGTVKGDGDDIVEFAEEVIKKATEYTKAGLDIAKQFLNKLSPLATAGIDFAKKTPPNN